jgi:hypothetical protein
VLKWLHSAGCPWDYAVCEAAAEGGYLEVLKWLHITGQGLTLVHFFSA